MFVPNSFSDGVAGGTPITAATLNNLENGLVAADITNPASAAAVALVATVIGRNALTTPDAGPATDTNLVVTGLNRSAAGGSSGIIRAEAQALSIVLNNNTGTDLGIPNAFEAVQFTNPAGITTFGSVTVRLKGSSIAGSATVICNIYTDNAGVPGTLLSLNNGSTVVYGKDIGTTYSPFQFLTRINSAANVPYWAVFSITGLSGGTLTLDTALTGSGGYANSPDGTTWTTGTRKPYIELRGQTNAALQGTSENYVGVRGDSIDYYGVYGNTISGIGVHGGSTSGFGVEGISASGPAGVKGVGSNGFGVSGDGTNAAGVYGTSANADGVYGVAVGANARGVFGTSNQTNGMGVYGTNSANSGIGIQGANLSGTGFGVKSEGYFGCTHGWGYTASAGAGAGTSPPAPATPNTNAVRGLITFGTGTTPTAGVQVVFAFPGGRPCPTTPVVVITPTNAATAALQLYVTAVSTTGFSVASAVAPTASQANTIYGVNFFSVG